jgi:hypothetical protein
MIATTLNHQSTLNAMPLSNSTAQKMGITKQNALMQRKLNENI